MKWYGEKLVRDFDLCMNDDERRVLLEITRAAQQFPDADHVPTAIEPEA